MKTLYESKLREIDGLAAVVWGIQMTHPHQAQYVAMLIQAMEELQSAEEAGKEVTECQT